MEFLGISLPGLITQLISFGILLIILWALLRKPAIRLLDDIREARRKKKVR